MKPARWRKQNDSVYVRLALHPHESMFVVLPKTAERKYQKAKEYLVEKTRYEAIEGDWDVEFCPKLLPSFEMTLENNRVILIFLIYT